MNYNDLKSIVASKKTTFKMAAPTSSFFLAASDKRPYIEPTFTKEHFSNENPQFLLVSAVGASGKSALASKLSVDTGMPMLDLGAHPPVADNTLTGLLTTCFPLEQLSGILTGLKGGAFGVIIDGIDEGRSKVNEAAFSAFLDDLVKLSAGSPRTTFTLLGRTQALIECWVHLEGKNATVGLASIDPFTRERASHYVDTFAEPPVLGQRAQYDATRDSILSRLAAAFPGENPKYLSFIGYPPVLDAIATLLRGQKNYHKLSEGLASAQDVEANLLYKIATYILDRERLEKVIPNTVKGLLPAFPADVQTRIESVAYNSEEQACRLIAHVLGQSFSTEVIPNPGLNAQYEEQLVTPVTEHPFLAGGTRAFRNAIFEAVCLGILMATGKSDRASLVDAYMAPRRGNLYLIQILNQIAPNCVLDKGVMAVLIGAALQFRSLESSAEITIEPSQSLDSDIEDATSAGEIEVDLQIEIVSSKADQPSRSFDFRSVTRSNDCVLLGPRLSNCFIEMPCEVTVSAPEEIELTAPIEIRARRINVLAGALVAKAQPKSDERDVILEAHEITSALTSMTVENGVEFTARVAESKGHHYPLFKYVRQREVLPTSLGVRARYLKLRKILTHFRSHSRGQMAKLCAKVENERVAGNATGLPVLERLIRDGVLVSDGRFYFLRPENVDKYLGVSWARLRGGEVNQKLIAYLQSIN